MIVEKDEGVDPENWGEVPHELPDIVASCCKTKISCGNHIFLDFGLESVNNSRHRDHVVSSNNITHNHYGSESVPPKLSDMIYTDVSDAS